MKNKIATDKKWLATRNKTRTGFCGNGHCEGTRPKNFRGIGLKTCHHFLTCPCQCHYEIDKMCEMADSPRFLIDNPEYHVERGHYIMPDVEEILAARRARETAEGRESIIDAPPEEILAGNVFRGTESGRRSRGQLEYQVLMTCIALGWPKHDIIPITPKQVSEYIATHERIAPPSTGAVQAIWDRWATIDFARLEKKPVRFGGFVDVENKPSVAILDLAKAKWSRNHKMEVVAHRRNKIQGSRK